MIIRIVWHLVWENCRYHQPFLKGISWCCPVYPHARYHNPIGKPRYNSPKKSIWRPSSPASMLSLETMVHHSIYIYSVLPCSRTISVCSSSFYSWFVNIEECNIHTLTLLVSIIYPPWLLTASGDWVRYPPQCYYTFLISWFSQMVSLVTGKHCWCLKFKHYFM